MTSHADCGLLIMDLGAKQADNLAANVGHIEDVACDDSVMLANDEEVDTLKDLSDAAHGGCLRRFTRLVGNGLVLSG